MSSMLLWGHCPCLVWLISIENSRKVPLLLQGWDSPQLILAVWKLNVFFMDVIWAVERI